MNIEDDKNKFLEALRKNNNKLDERALGESLGFSKAHTDEIIAALLADEKIEYSTDQTSSYKIKD